MAKDLLILFVVLSVVKEVLETLLSRANRRYYESLANQDTARQILNISKEEIEKALVYSRDRQEFGLWSGWIKSIAMLAALSAGWLGFIDRMAQEWVNSWQGGPIQHGVVFFGLLGLISAVLNLPFGWYSQFVIEKKHGFNRQTPRAFLGDFVKGLVLSAVLGGLLLGMVLAIMMSLGDAWWYAAWAAVSAFSLIAMWIYPRVLAPLFNKFRAVEEGELRDGIAALAAKVGFRMGGIFVMDASKRSSHGNAYFTGLFGEKRIVLFDTLVDAMSVNEVVAVLAHELGHFKLNHVRWALIRSLATTGAIFYLMSRTMHMENFYLAFSLPGFSFHGALLLFSMWFGLVDFPLQLLGNHISRRNEFAADAFAKEALGESKTLADALLKLREKSHMMPIAHPWYSRFYHSHPPLTERLVAMGGAHGAGVRTQGV